MSTPEELTYTLKQAEMRITPQRIAICKLLSENDGHPTAARIYEQLREQYPTLSLATVYNTLDALAGLGAVNVLGHVGDDNVHYDGNTTPHAHVACISCFKIEDVFSPLVADLDSEIKNALGYKLLGARILYYGLCPDCQESNS